MKCLSVITFVACAATIALPGHAVAAGDIQDQAVLHAQKVFEQSLRKSDKVMLGKLLDEDFVWTFADGNNATKDAVLANLPSPVLSSTESGTQIIERTYGQVAVLQEHSETGRTHALAIYVKRASTWNLLLVNEITNTPIPEHSSVASDLTRIKKCINPCQNFPAESLTLAEKEAILSWLNQGIAHGTNDPDLFNRVVGDEWIAYGNAGGPESKAARMASLIKAREAGDPGWFKGHPPTAPALGDPPPFKVGRLWDFGNVVILLDRDPSNDGKVSSSARVWVKRRGTFQVVAAFHMPDGRGE